MQEKKQARVLGLDVGDERIGLAISDELGITVTPYATLERRNNRYINAIIQLIVSQNVGTVLIGLPLEMNGNVGPQAEKVQEVGKKLQESLNRRKLSQEVLIKYWDERLSTVQAKRLTAGKGLLNKDCRSDLDKVSAALMVEAYLSALP